MLADRVATLLGTGDAVGLRMPDGSTAGPVDERVTLVVRDDQAIQRVLVGGELGLVRAYVSGEVEVEGDFVEAIRLLWQQGSGLGPTPARLRTAGQLLRHYGARRVPPPAEEVRLLGRVHSLRRDAAAIAYHYDVSNEFYHLLLGDSMCYSCAVWSEPGIDLVRAQELKHQLVADKLGLTPGMRLLDAGCGWGTFARFVARNHGVRVTAVTLSRAQAEYVRQAVEADGLGSQIDVRHQDYRSVDDGPYDAIASIGMFEHVGRDLPTYSATMARLLATSGRFLHHAISRVAPMKGPGKRSFLQRYVFPDGELKEIGTVVSSLHGAGLEVRHIESLRDHYPLTLRAWMAQLDAAWPTAVELVGEPRARIWRLYMAAGMLAFEANENQVHQVLAVRPVPGAQMMSLTPGDWTPVAEASAGTVG